MIKNRAASIRARLKQHSDMSKQDFNLTLIHYGLERLLYRMSISEHGQNFLLKGALLFALWYDVPHRPTRDADLLGFGPDDIHSVEKVFRNLSRMIVDDGIEFDPQSVKGTKIRKEAGYGGVRVDMVAKLDGARIALQIDIGFGDAVTPGPESVTYPVLLNDLPAPTLRTYPKYTVVAEKFQAICVLGMTNSRMKDYFDLWVLLRDGDLDNKQLRRAIDVTLKRRNTPQLTSVPVGLTQDFAADTKKQVQWRAFLKKNQLELIAFNEVVKILRNNFQKIGAI